jgi:hypothetical protein
MLLMQDNELGYDQARDIVTKLYKEFFDRDMENLMKTNEEDNLFTNIEPMQEVIPTLSNYQYQSPAEIKKEKILKQYQGEPIFNLMEQYYDHVLEYYDAGFIQQDAIMWVMQDELEYDQARDIVTKLYKEFFDQYQLMEQYYGHVLEYHTAGLSHEDAINSLMEDEELAYYQSFKLVTHLYSKFLDHGMENL